jgi:hypothetical protein
LGVVDAEQGLDERDVRFFYVRAEGGVGDVGTAVAEEERCDGGSGSGSTSSGHGG